MSGTTRLIRGLHLPADLAEGCRIVQLPPSDEAAYRRMVGGGLVERAQIRTTSGTAYAVVGDLNRSPGYNLGLRNNVRATRFADALDWGADALLFGLFGDILVLGLGPEGADVDLPSAAVSCDVSVGVLDEGAPRGGHSQGPRAGRSSTPLSCPSNEL